jgi:hypothetical protein
MRLRRKIGKRLLRLLERKNPVNNGPCSLRVRANQLVHVVKPVNPYEVNKILKSA